MPTLLRWRADTLRGHATARHLAPRRSVGSLLRHRRELVARLRTHHRGPSSLRDRCRLRALLRDTNGDASARSRARPLRRDRRPWPSRVRPHRCRRGGLLGRRRQHSHASGPAAGALRCRQRRAVPHLRPDQGRRGGVLGVEQLRTGRCAAGPLHRDQRGHVPHLRHHRVGRVGVLGRGLTAQTTYRPGASPRSARATTGRAA